MILKSKKKFIIYYAIKRSTVHHQRKIIVIELNKIGVTLVTDGVTILVTESVSFIHKTKLTA